MLARNATANQSHTATNVHLDDDPGPAMVRGRGSNHSKAQNKSNRAIQIARQSLRVYARRHECMCVCASTCMAGCLPGRRAEHTRQWRSNERQRNSMPEEDLNKNPTHHSTRSHSPTTSSNAKVFPKISHSPTTSSNAKVFSKIVVLTPASSITTQSWFGRIMR